VFGAELERVRGDFCRIGLNLFVFVLKLDGFGLIAFSFLYNIFLLRFVFFFHLIHFRLHSGQILLDVFNLRV